MRIWMAAVTAVVVLATQVFAGTVRRDFLPDGVGFAENPLVEGRTTFRYDECQQITHLRLNVEGLLPNTTYGVRWESDGPILDNPAAFTTDEEGDARYVDYQLGDASADPVVIIYVDDSSAGRPGEYDAGEDRAFSYIPFARIRCFHPSTPNSCADGNATIRYQVDSGLTTFRLVLRDLWPNTTYGVLFESEGGPSLDNPAAFTTNRRGVGKYDDYLIGVATRNVVMTIYIRNPAGDDNVVEPDEIRASGTSADNDGCGCGWDD